MKLHNTTSNSFSSINLSSIMKGQAQNSKKLYELLLGLGYQYGKGLQVIENIWQYEDKWLIELKVSNCEKGQKGQKARLNIALLDGFFQTVLIVEYFLAGQQPKDNTLHVPYIIKSFNVFSEVRERCFVYIGKQDIQNKDGDLYVQLRVYNAVGEGILQINGMVFKRVSNQFLKLNSDRFSKITKSIVSDEVHLYQPTWIPLPLSYQKMDLSQRYAIIFADNRLATQLYQEITQYYQKTFIINKGGAFLHKDSGYFEINATAEGDYLEVIQQIFAQVNNPLEGYDVYYLWAYTPEAFSVFNEYEFKTRQETGVQSLFFLTKVLSTLKPKNVINIIVATHQTVIVTEQDKGEGYGYGGLFGLAKTVMLENPSFTIKIVDVADEAESMFTLLPKENFSQDSSSKVAYRNQVRYVQVMESVSLAENCQELPLLKEKGVYLLIGGLGSIGFSIAKLITQQPKKTCLILLGRSGLSVEKQQYISQLQKTGSEVLYLQANVTNLTQMKDVITNLKQRYGAINGVIQASGVLEDKLLVNKDWESFQRVMSPKVQGTWILNQLTQTEPLDFFIVFSSIVAVTGNIGQVDYATANSFLDTFTHYRSRHNYPGKSLSINWTLWADSGMGQNLSVLEAFSKKSGVISRQAGLNAFVQLLNGTLCQYIVVGHSQVFESNSTNHKKQTSDIKTERVNFISSSRMIEGNRTILIKKELAVLIASKIDTSPEKIDNEESFFSMGVESIMLQDIMTALEKKYGPLPPTLLFEYPNIRQLAEYLKDKLLKEEKMFQLQPVIHDEIITQNELNNNLENETVNETVNDTLLEASKPVLPITFNKTRQKQSVNLLSEHSGYEIAIIGMNGRFPKSPNLEIYWQNLVAGQDCIEEIPAERWKYQSFFDVDPNVPNKTYGKWGGFIKDVDKFEPLFFKISPREAEQMDPQQRLFLECTWETMEHAGYGDRKQYHDKIVGLYVGVMWNEYSLLSNQEGFLNNQYVGPGSLYWAIANRVSYCMDFTGPSIAIDTACSSSLVAVHLACQSILARECDMAIAGGVNLSIHPSKYIYLGQAQFLSKDGKCRSFGQDGTGYVPGEGVGAVLLKSLKQALFDGDHIYGIIRGSSTNHGGKATGFTVPNPKAQTRLITHALERAKISPNQISYVECHGTGTSLGDPVEIEGLSEAFRHETNNSQFCPIGSVKSNIGHLEAAAGIAALIKVLLCMAHKKIPKSLHSDIKNTNINFEKTPFYVVNQTTDWISELSNPRIAGISSFGAGGANAHLIVEEYKPPLRETSITVQKSQLIVLSAKNENRLHAYITKIIEFLDSPVTEITSCVETTIDKAEFHQQQIQQYLLKVASEILKVSDSEIKLDGTFDEYGFEIVSLTELSHRLNDKYQADITPVLLLEQESLGAVAQYLLELSQKRNRLKENTFTANPQINLFLADLAYTLQIGREAMEERLAIVVESVEDLRDKLIQYIQEKRNIDDFYRGNAKTGKTYSELLVEGREGEEFVKIIINDRKLNKLAQLWVSGVNIDWKLLYPNYKPQRISLPTYPFARERYWIPQVSEPNCNKVVSVIDPIAKLHPLLGSNTSTLTESRFTTQFDGQEFYLTDHLVADQKIIPAVASLEMARAAGELAGEKPVYQLSNIVLARPIAVSNTSRSVNISLYPTETQQHLVKFEVSSLDDNQQRQVHVQGKLSYDNQTALVSETVDIEAIQNRCPIIHDHAECYREFRAIGIHYGPTFQAIQTMYTNGENEALAHIILPGDQQNIEDFVLHPSLMDGAGQVTILMMVMNQATTGIPYIPFAIGEVTLTNPLSSLPTTCYSHATLVTHLHAEPTVKKFNFQLLDQTGKVLVKVKDVSLRLFSSHVDTSSKMYYYRKWEKSLLADQIAITPTTMGTILLFDTGDSLYHHLKVQLKSEVILVTPGESYQVLSPQIYSINPNQSTDYRQLLASLKQQNRWPHHIIHLWSQTLFVNDVEALTNQLGMSFYSVFHLSQALQEQKLTNTVQLLYLYLETAEKPQPQYAAVSGFARAIGAENPKLIYKTVAIQDVSNVLEVVLAEFQTTDSVEIRYQNQQRWVKHWQELEVHKKQDTFPLLKEHGVYLITGGAGGLGLIFAEYLAKIKAKIVLTGRSALNAEKSAQIQALNSSYAEVIYLQADVSKRDDVETLVAQIKARFQELNGIIHSAGVALPPSIVVNKTQADVATVLAPKIDGTVYLDEATKEEPLDFLVLFSSIAAVIGLAGQTLSDYAYANSFLDNFAIWRESQRVVQKRFGKTLSINWPLWQNGRMQVDKQAEKWLADTMGMQALLTETGLEAFSQGLAWEKSQILVVEGHRQKIKKMLLEVAVPQQHTATMLLPTPIKGEQLTEDQLLEQLQKDLLSMVSVISKLNTKDINLSEDLGEYGFDSISFMEFANQVNDKYQLEITPAILFEYPSVGAFSEFLSQEYQEHLLNDYLNHFKAVSTPIPNSKTATEANTVTLAPSPTNKGQLLEQLQKDLLSMVSVISKINTKDINLSEDLGEYGFDSISFMEFANQVNDKFQLEITPAILFEYPSVGAFSEFLSQEYRKRFFDYYIF